MNKQRLLAQFIELGWSREEPEAIRATGGGVWWQVLVVAVYGYGGECRGPSSKRRRARPLAKPSLPSRPKSLMQPLRALENGLLPRGPLAHRVQGAQ
jgi:hypothetical protein